VLQLRRVGTHFQRLSQAFRRQLPDLLQLPRGRTHCPRLPHGGRWRWRSPVLQLWSARPFVARLHRASQRRKPIWWRRRWQLLQLRPTGSSFPRLHRAEARRWWPWRFQPAMLQVPRLWPHLSRMHRVKLVRIDAHAHSSIELIHPATRIVFIYQHFLETRLDVIPRIQNIP